MTLAGRLRTALQSAGGMLIHDVAPDGRWLVTRDDIRRDTFVRAPGQTAEKNLSWLDLTDVVALSRDGKTLLMTEEGATAGVNYQVALRKTDGSPVIRLGEGSAADLSPDGRWALAAIPTDPDRLILYPTGAGEPKSLPAGPIRTYLRGYWTRDGRSIILWAAESGHASRCYLQSPDGGDPKPITPEGTGYCFLSPDGASVITGSSTNEFKRYPVDGSAPTPVTVINPDEEIVRWNPDGRSLLVRRYGDVPSRIERLDLASGRREQVALLGPADPAGVLQINAVAFSDDTTAYAYSCLRYLSHLFVVDGVR